jgi:pyrroline-5-carboxylate reductase
MGRALAAGWLAAGRPGESLAAMDPSPDARSAAGALGIRVVEPGGDVPNDVIVLAVKPPLLSDVLDAIRDVNGGVYLSIVAGKTIEQIERSLPADTPVVRAMPNTPAAIGRGITGLCSNDAVSAEQRDLCTELMEAVGEAVWVEDEALMDAVTAVSGSGPAYVFLLIECLAAAARRQGIGREVAERLAIATVAGSGAYAAGTTEDPAVLRQRVTSPNGTTAAALDVLMRDDGLEALIDEAVAAAARRSRELSRG